MNFKAFPFEYVTFYSMPSYIYVEDSDGNILQKTEADFTKVLPDDKVQIKVTLKYKDLIKQINSGKIRLSFGIKDTLPIKTVCVWQVS